MTREETINRLDGVVIGDHELTYIDHTRYNGESYIEVFHRKDGDALYFEPENLVAFCREVIRRINEDTETN
jgi:hypothetical protein